jgi:hypothetical protein
VHHLLVITDKGPVRLKGWGIPGRSDAQAVRRHAANKAAMSSVESRPVQSVHQCLRHRPYLQPPPSDQAKDNQQHNCSYKSVNNQGNNAYTKMDI